jgi:hypothetical protein
MDSTATATPSHQNIADAPQEHGRSSAHPKNMAAPLKTIKPGIAGDRESSLEQRQCPPRRPLPYSTVHTTNAVDDPTHFEAGFNLPPREETAKERPAAVETAPPRLPHRAPPKDESPCRPLAHHFPCNGGLRAEKKACAPPKEALPTLHIAKKVLSRTPHYPSTRDSSDLP